MPLRIKRILNKNYKQGSLSYGAECWTMKREDEKKLKTTETRMLRMLCGKTLKDKVSDDKIREVTGFESINEFLREQRL